LKRAIIEIIKHKVNPATITLAAGLTCDIKSNCGFNNELTGFLLCPAKLDWNDKVYVPLQF
jgi:hypothetical protein